ncbi:MAG: 1-(5-phosphoribosyl)-5-[Clostridia bacterium]|nr:1-(5-phosphoribosyl)-5-[(5-phosphoribosylamino)methylideneamino]imidazole-4-carboxamide isomerase [Clostridia bacterium]
MILFPAIDLYNGCAVRLLHGDYDKMTVYSNDPAQIAFDFKSCGAEAIHVVDLQGARDGTTPNFDTVLKIKNESGLFCEIGGGVRSMQVIEKYLDAGLDRVILGTSALKDTDLLLKALDKYGEKIAVGADIKNGKIAVKGWLESSDTDIYTFCDKMQSYGVKTLICTDISTDGALKGTNRALYKELTAKYGMDITASGGVSTLEDIKELKACGCYGAIIGRAYYEKKIDLRKAAEISV